MEGVPAMSTFTDQFFTRTAVGCTCGKSNLYRMNTLLICPECGFYSQKHFQSPKNNEAGPALVTLPHKAQGFLMDCAAGEGRQSA
jgi:hypothetical protein